MSHVFASYSHKDNDFALLLQRTLEQEGIKTWLAVESLKAGEEWREGIDEAIRASYAMIVVLSPDSDESKYVTYEWAFAYGLGIKIIPIMLRRPDKSIHPRLENLQFEDFSHATNRPWSRLVQRLQEIQKVALERERRDPKIEQAIHTLRSSFKAKDRLEAAQALGQFKAQTSVPVLLETINDSSAEVRLAIIVALGEIGDIQAIPRLLEIIHHHEEVESLRIAAIHSIGKIDPNSIEDNLIGVLSSKRKKLLKAAIEELKKSTSVRAIDAFVQLLLSRIEEHKFTHEETLYEDLVKDEIISLLFEIVTGKAQYEQVELLLPLLKHKSKVIRRNVVKVIAAAHSDRFSDDLILSALRDADNEIRTIAIDGLIELSKTQDLKSNLKKLGDPERENRNIAIDYVEANLGTVGLLVALAENDSQAYWQIAERIESRVTNEEREILLQSLSSKIITVRAFSAEILGKIGYVDSCTALKALINDKSSFVRGIAIRAIGRLGCKGVIRQLKDKLIDKAFVFSKSSNTVSDYAAIALANLGHKSELSYLIQILKSAKTDLHDEAIQGLVKIGDKSIIPTLRELLSSDELPVFESALIAIGQLQYQFDLQELLEALNSEYEEERMEAIDSLAKIETPYGLVIALCHQPVKSYWEIEAKLKFVLPTNNPELVSKLLTHIDREVRAFTAEAIGKRPDIGCLPELIGLLNDKASFVRGLAIRAVGRLGCEDSYLQPKLTDNETIFSNSSIRVCDYAAIARAKNGHFDGKRLIQALVLAIDNDSIASGEVILLLKQYISQVNIDDIKELVASQNPQLRSSAAEILASLGDHDQGKKLLLNLLMDENVDVTISAVGALQNYATLSEDVKQRLIPLMDSNVPRLQKVIAKVAGIHKCNELFPKIFKVAWRFNSYEIDDEFLDAIESLMPLEKKENIVNFLTRVAVGNKHYRQTKACQILRTIGDVSSARKLLAMFSTSPNVTFRYDIIKTINQIGDTSLTDDLKLYFDSKYSDVRIAAARIAGELQIQSLYSEVIHLLNNPDTDVILSALIALQEIGDETCIPLVLPLLSSQDEGIVGNAIKIIAKFGGKNAYEHVMSCAASGNDILLFFVLEALTYLKDTRAIPFLINLTETEEIDDSFRQEAILTIGTIGDSSVASLIRKKFLQDEDEEIRYVAIQALGQLVDNDAIDDLAALLDDRTESYRGMICDAAANSLMQIGTDKALEALASWRKRLPTDVQDDD